MISKKAQIGKGETLVLIIIVIAVSIVLGAAFYNWLEKGKETVDDNVCRNSILLNSKIAGKTLGQFQPQINCPAPSVQITSSEKNEDLAKKEVAGKIAKEMYSCWYKVGEGEAEPFNGFSVWNNKLICIVCSGFTIDRYIDIGYVYEALYKQSPSGKDYWDFFDVWQRYTGGGGKYFFNIKKVLQNMGSLTTEYLTKENFFITGSLRAAYLSESNAKKAQKLVSLDKDKSYTIMATFYYSNIPKGLDYITFFVTPSSEVSSQGCDVMFNQKQKS